MLALVTEELSFVLSLERILFRADAGAMRRFLRHFVQAEEAGLPPAADSEASAAVKASPRASQSPKSGHDFAVLEDPHLSESSSAVGLMSQLLNLVTLTRRLAASTQRQDAS